MPNEPEPIALIDLDNSVADYSKSMNSWLKLLRAPEETFRVDRTIGYDNDPAYMSARRKVIQSLPGFWRSLEEIELGFDVVKMLLELDYRLHVLTKGPSSKTSTAAFAEKVDWSRQHLPGVPVTISDDKGLVYGKVLLDDWPPYVERWLQWRPRGLVIAVAQSWNTDIESLNERIIRYDGSNREYVKEMLYHQRRNTLD
jgi:5'-nucleotidase